MDVDPPLQNGSLATQTAGDVDQTRSDKPQSPPLADSAMDVDVTSSAPGASAAAVETPIVEEVTTEAIRESDNGETVQETNTSSSSTYPEGQPPSLPQTINPADLFSVPPPSNSDAASTDISMTEAQYHAPAPDHPTLPETATTNAPAGPSTLSQPISLGTSLATRQRSTSPARIYRTGYIYDPLMMLHCPDGYTPTADSAHSGDNHPEEPMRIKRIYSRLSEHGLIKRMKKLDFQEVTFEQVMTVHSEGHWDKVQGTEFLSDDKIQESKHYYDQLSLYVCRETAHCARLSCGGVIQACLSVCKGEVRNAFAIVRPPGHHAEPEEHMGFCFFNNVAVAAKEVQKQGLAKKVLILDWDVHHGNGTQRAFWDDPDTLYVSIHRHDGGNFYPTSDFGAIDMVGGGAGEGKSVNIAWPTSGFGDGDYIYAFQKIIMPIAYEFAPDLVIISAGFDAAEGDQLGQCHVSPAAYGHMTHMLCALASGKVVVALEGGYNLQAISNSAFAVAQVLLGETPPELGALQASEVATEVIHQVAKVHSKYWKSIDPLACEPPEVTEIDDKPATLSIPDLLKIHRAHHMFEKHRMFQIPLASEELESAFGGQVICNEGVYEAGPKSTLVVFVHDFGNLRVETDGVATSNISLTNSYLIDTSDLIVNWVKDNGYNIIDVNVLKQLPTQLSREPGPKSIRQQGPEEERSLIKYLWDNYIELSEAENVILIGHGTGCQVIMDLVNHREVERKVKAVIQVAGLHYLVRPDPQNESRRNWFRASNRIYVPTGHPILSDERIKKRLGGQVFTSEHAKVVDVLNDVLPQIKTYVASKLSPPLPLASDSSAENASTQPVPALA